MDRDLQLCLNKQKRTLRLSEAQVLKAMEFEVRYNRISQEDQGDQAVNHQY